MSRSLRSRERRGLLLAFAVFGAFWGSWAAVLPDVRTRSGLDDGRLGVALGAIALAALPAMPLAGRLADRHGARRVLPAALMAFAGVSVVLGFASGPVALVGALLLLGAVTGVLDVTMSAGTAAWERLEADRLMSLVHGLFSVGMLGGAALTGVARSLGAGPELVLGTTGLVILAAALAQPAYRQASGGPAPVVRRRIAPMLMALGAVVAVSFLLEDAVQSWSALHLERTRHAAPWLSGLAPGLFAGAMAVGRLASHALVRPGQQARAVGLGGVVTTAGLLLLALAPSAVVALAGAALAGAGVSVLAPTLLSAVAARSAPGRQGADLAMVTAFGYAGFVTGPLVVGLLSDALSLPTALALLALLAAGVAVAGPSLLRRPPQVSAVLERGSLTATSRRP